MDKAELIKYIILSATVIIYITGIAGAMDSSPDLSDNNTELFSINYNAEDPLATIIPGSKDNLPAAPEAVLISEENIAENKNNTTDKDKSGDSSFNPEFRSEESALKNSNTSINFFYSERCGACHKALPVVKELAVKYPNIPVYYYDTYKSPENRSIMYRFAEYYGIDYPAYPNVFAGDSTYLEGFTEINNNIEDIFTAYDKGLIPDIEYEYKWQEKREGNLSTDNYDGNSFIRSSGSGAGKVTLPLVIIGGLLDGINPCAISVLLILLASLSAAGSRRTILSAGISYTLAVFIFYTLAGVGILAITGLAGISYYFSVFAFAVALVAGILSIYEGITGEQQNIIRITDSSKSTLKKYFGKLGDNKDYEDNNASDENKDIINNFPADESISDNGSTESIIPTENSTPEISRNIDDENKSSGKKTGYIITTAFILGTLASMFELPCTGGIYVAVLSMISSTFSESAVSPEVSGISGIISGEFITGIIYLLIYNLMFILPLIIIIAFMASGLPAGRIEKINTFRTEKRRAIRIISGIIMIILAIYLGLGIAGMI